MNGAPQVTIITSITDGYDTLKAITPQFGIGVQWLAVTDGKETAEPDHGWEVVPIMPRSDAGQATFEVYSTEADETHPNRLAKVVKCMPWVVANTAYTIWIDGSYRVTSPLFAFEAIKFANPIAQFVHPWRDCVYEEGQASKELIRYDDQRQMITAQQREYFAIGHPEHWGLWATGVIVRKRTPDVSIFGEQWLAEIRRHSYQDQISEPVSLRMCDLRPNPLPGDHITNPWLRYEGSARH